MMSSWLRILSVLVLSPFLILPSCTSTSTTASVVSSTSNSHESSTTFVPVGDYLYYEDLGGRPYTVTADTRSFIINGQRTLLLGGSVHYPRMSFAQWRRALTNLKRDGLNHVQTYVFWSLHEPVYNFNGTHVYHYGGRANLTHYLSIAAEVGLFVNLRMGPFVAAEWRWGALPPYLLHVPGIVIRAHNAPWMQYMQAFVEEIASVVRPFLAKNGGPIILAQIENEYHGAGANGAQYVEWCGTLALSLDFGVPWMMCNGESSNLTINTYNGDDPYPKYLIAHEKKYAQQPLGWTENEGWYQAWQGDDYNVNTTANNNRSPQDMANVVAKWMGAGACHHNYYMYFGGNHIRNYAGSGITNYYADGVNYHADGLPHEPKRSHLNRLHHILAEHQHILLYYDPDDPNHNTYGYGHEIPLNATSDDSYLYIDTCDETSKKSSQTWLYAPSTLLLYMDALHCATATGKSNPIAVVPCDAADANQHWLYNRGGTSLQFVSAAHSSSCLDVAKQTMAADEWQCKNADANRTVNNQQWRIDASTHTIRPMQDLSTCLTLKAGPTTVTNLFAYEYRGANAAEDVLVFLYNNGSSAHTVRWKEGMTYFLPALSVSIVDAEGVELYNTAAVNTQGLPTQRVYHTVLDATQFKFASWREPVPVPSATRAAHNDFAVANPTPFEQTRFTNDTNQHLVYATTLALSAHVLAAHALVLSIKSYAADAFAVFLDDAYIGQAWNGDHKILNETYLIALPTSGLVPAQPYVLTIVSTCLGLATHTPVEVPPSGMDKKGIVVDVGGVALIDGQTQAVVMDLNEPPNGADWTHWIGLTGEVLDVASAHSSTKTVNWTAPAVQQFAMTWYRTSFTLTAAVVQQLVSSGYVLLLDIGAKGTGMGRGHWWLNGEDMGYYNSVIQAGVMMQRYYFMAHDFLLLSETNATTNWLVFQEELPGVNVDKVTIVTSTVVIPA